MTLAARFTLAGLLVPLLAFLVSGCARESAPVELGGDTMGTTWHVTYIPETQSPEPAVLKREIAALLDDINASMSTYRDDSEITRFNRAPPGEWFDVSDAFLTVLQAALRVGEKSSGAYDVTVGPLVELWGFGASTRSASVPDDRTIEQVQKRVGAGKLQVDAAQSRILKQRDIALDFSSLAKGYGVDRVSVHLEERGIHRHLVEIGGELRSRGLSPGDDPWRVAIEKPTAGGREPALVIALRDTAVATSGDYRNFFEVDGKRYSHSIDPRSGYPVSHDLVSVTVMHDSAMVADAWATALVVLGYNEGRELSEERGLAVYFMRRAQGGFEASATPAFEVLLAGPR